MHNLLPIPTDLAWLLGSKAFLALHRFVIIYLFYSLVKQGGPLPTDFLPRHSIPTHPHRFFDTLDKML